MDPLIAEDIERALKGVQKAKSVLYSFPHTNRDNDRDILTMLRESEIVELRLSRALEELRRG